MRFSAGDSFGRYRIEALLGAGGMGVVYRAHDTLLERPVAIKVLSAEKTAANTLANLLSEARSASALNHPNVCTIYEVGEEGECAFIAMEYVEGRTLDSLIAKGPLSISSATEYALQIADALSHAHERGVIHGDLKTVNILVSSRNRVKIVDFGLARRPEENGADRSSATTAVIAGTPHAMAPELFRGDTPDPQSDVWSLGVVFFEILAGARPFTGETTAELAASILRDPPASLPERVPVVLRRAVELCLAKDPSHRFRDAREVRVALELTHDTARGLLRSDDGGESVEWSLDLPPAIGNVQSSSIELVGRESDLAILNAAMERARAGRRQFVFVAGEAGIGKTRLTSEFARSVASTGAAVLLGRCDAEALIPYQPFVEALDWYVRSCPSALLHAQLRDVETASELAGVIPSIARRFSAPLETVESNAEGRRYRLFEATASFLARISRTRPLLVLLEDVHWADPPTLLMLRHVLRSSHEGALLLVATYRETELDRTHPLADILASLRREPAAANIRLRGLNEREITRFVDGWLGKKNAAPSLVKLVGSNTEGNPLFMTEVLRHLDELGKLAELQTAAGPHAVDIGLPDGVREVIGKRVSRLSDDCRRALAVAAVVGRDFTFPVLQAVTDFPEDRLLDVIDEAQSSRVIQEAPGTVDGYTFSHALIRETLYGELTASRRVRLHRKVAEALEALMKPGQEPLADLAYHYVQAASSKDVEKAVTFAARAAEAAAARFAIEDAGRFYGMALQALDLLPDEDSIRARRRDLHIKSGKAFGSIGQWAAAVRHFKAALLLLPPDSREQRAELLVQLALASFWSLNIPELRQFASEAVEIADAIGRDDLWAEAMSCAASADNADGNVLKAVETDRLAIDRAGGIKSLGMARCVVSLYHAGLTDESIIRANQSLKSARAGGDPAFVVYSLTHLGLSNAGLGRYDEALRAFDEARAYARRYGVFPFLARGISMSTGMHIALGNLSTAETFAHEARDIARQAGFAPALISSGIDLLFIHTRSGELGRAEALLDEVAAAARSIGGWHGWLWELRLIQVRAELALAKGDWRAAAEHAGNGIVQCRARHRLKYEALAHVTRARALVNAQDRPAALKDAAHAVVLARRLGDPAVLIDALAAHLKIEGNDTLLAEARTSIQNVVETLTDERMRRQFLDLQNVNTILKL